MTRGKRACICRAHVCLLSYGVACVFYMCVVPACVRGCGCDADREAVEAIRRLRELNQTYYMHEFVKRLCVVAMDGGDSHVALASNLLDRAVGVNVLLPGVFTHGLQRLIAATDDLALDGAVVRLPAPRLVRTLTVVLPLSSAGCPPLCCAARWRRCGFRIRVCGLLRRADTRNCRRHAAARCRRACPWVVREGETAWHLAPSTHART